MAKRDELIDKFALAEERHPKKEEKKQLTVPVTDGADGSAQPEQADAAQPQEAAGNEKKNAAEAHKPHRKKGFRHFVKTCKSIVRDKTLNKMLNVFLVCLIINALEYFMLINYFGIQTRGALGKFVGAVVIFYYLYKARLKPRDVGLSQNRRAVMGGIKNALIFNTALIPAYLMEILFYRIKHQKVTVTIFAYSAIHSDVGPVYWIANILLLLIINALAAFMLEILFRGILMKMGKAKFGFWQTTVIVSIFYSIWYLIIPLSKVTNGYKPLQLLSLCVFYLIFEFFVSIKWCMCLRATGSIWLSVFDHFIFTTAVSLIRVVNLEPGVINNIDSMRNYRLIVIQLISFVFCYLYYRKKMRRKERLLLEAGVHSFYAFDSLADMSEEDVERQAERIKTADGDIDSEYLKHIEKLQSKKGNDRGHH